MRIRCGAAIRQVTAWLVLVQTALNRLRRCSRSRLSSTTSFLSSILRPCSEHLEPGTVLRRRHGSRTSTVDQETAGVSCTAPDPIGLLKEEHALQLELCELLEVIAMACPPT